MRPLFRLSLLMTLLCTLPAPAAEARRLTGNVKDASGQVIAGASVVLQSASEGIRRTTSDLNGHYVFDDVLGEVTLDVLSDGFTSPHVKVSAHQSDVPVLLEPAPVTEEISVYAAPVLPTRSSTATKTDTPLRDVPQSVTVISKEIIAQQTMQSMGDVVRYIPGIGMAQGEGNRDTPVFRGSSSTADFFVDGARDDVQYFRDLYNVERVEALKGPNAMIFGRGGVGGVINRVTRQADWSNTRELTMQGGSWGNRRVSGDFGQILGETAAARVTGFLEDSESYRNGMELSRYGINPTFAFAIGGATMLRAGFEHFRDDRTADRGIPSFAGKPVSTEASTFFGNSDLSNAAMRANVFTASIDHRFSDLLSLRSRITYGDYDKFYQNVFPGAVDKTGANVSLSAYNHTTERRNLFHQADLVVNRKIGRIGHTLLAGVELGRQVTDNVRNTGYFTSLGANVTTVSVPLGDPSTSLPMTFRLSATDAVNHSVASVAAIYVQDQVVLSPHLQVIGGLRYDRFEVGLLNRRTAVALESRDGLLSPRLGVVYKPIEPLSIYASFSLAYLPRAGEQLSSLNLSNQALDPEQFRNYEVGIKSNFGQQFEVSASAYRLDRSNVAMPDPASPSFSILVDGQRTHGIELSASGNIRKSWSVTGAYAYQDGEILNSISATAQTGARLAQLPKHSFSIWNKVDFRAWGAGLGLIHRGEIFTSTDNTVTLPAFTRVDAALFYTFNQRIRAQINIENLLDTTYYASAQGNSNITPGSPRAVRVSWTTRF
jgi:catecholate siderophore receptor